MSQEDEESRGVKQSQRESKGVNESEGKKESSGLILIYYDIF